MLVDGADIGITVAMLLCSLDLRIKPLHRWRIMLPEQRIAFGVPVLCPVGLATHPFAGFCGNGIAIFQRSAKKTKLSNNKFLP